MPAAAPAPAAPETPLPAGGERVASLGDRLIAVVLDSVVLLAAFAVIGMWVAVRMGGITESGFSMEGKPALVAFGAALLVGFLYYLLFEGLFGATLGKAMVGLRVRLIAGGRCSFGASLARNLLRIIDAVALYLVGFLVAVFSKSRQRIGDHAAGTIVVEHRTGTVARAGILLVWLVLIAAGLVGAYMLHRGRPLTTTTRGAETPVVRRGQLSIVNFRFVESKGGPARAAAPYKPGDTVNTTFDVAGFTTDADGQVDLALRLAALDPSGLALYRPWEDRAQKRIAADAPANWDFHFDLPPYAPAGTYKVEVWVRDGVKNTEASTAQTLMVDAPPFQPASELQVRGFQFSSSKDGPAEDPMIVKAGGTVNMSGRIAGIQFQQDRPNTLVALHVIGPKGNVLLNEPKYIELTDERPYHPPVFFVPIAGWVSLPSGASAGVYTVRYTIADHVATKTITHEAKFEVR
jgi:uncharacterized RDD family membrane protein YckC